MREDYSFDSCHYYRVILDLNTGIWWHFYYDEITKISNIPYGLYTRENHQ